MDVSSPNLHSPQVFYEWRLLTGSSRAQEPSLQVHSSPPGDSCWVSSVSYIQNVFWFLGLLLPFNEAYLPVASWEREHGSKYFKTSLVWKVFILSFPLIHSLAGDRMLAWKQRSFRALLHCFSAFSVATENSEAVTVPPPSVWKLLPFSSGKYWVTQLMISSAPLCLLTFYGSCNSDVCLLLDRLSNLTFSFQLPSLCLFVLLPQSSST